MIYTISFQKGGVGKTMTSFHLAHLLKNRGSTLLIDLDPQASLTNLMQSTEKEPSSFGIFRDEDWQSNIEKIADIDFVSSTFSDHDFDMNITVDERFQITKNFEMTLRNSEYANIIIDCGPGQTTATIAAQRAADIIITPFATQESSFPSFDSTVELLREWKMVSKIWILPNMYDARISIQKTILDTLHQSYPNKCFEPIPQSTAIAEIWNTGKPVWETKNRVGQKVKDIFNSIIERVNP